MSPPVRKFGTEIGNITVDKSKQTPSKFQHSKIKSSPRSSIGDNLNETECVESELGNLHVEEEVVSLTEDNVIGLSIIKIKINRGPRGFGFSVTSTLPPIVCMVFGESPAFKSGLKVGDQIIKLNGKISTEYQISEIIRLILNQAKHVDLVVSRPFMVNTNTRNVNVVEKLRVSEGSPKMIKKIMKAFNNFSKKSRKRENLGKLVSKGVILNENTDRGHFVEEWLNKMMLCSPRKSSDDPRTSTKSISFDTTCDINSNFVNSGKKMRLNEKCGKAEEFMVPYYLTPLEDEDVDQSDSSISLNLNKADDLSARILALKLLDVEMHVSSRLLELTRTDKSALKFAESDNQVSALVSILLNEMVNLAQIRMEEMRNLLNKRGTCVNDIILVYESQIANIRFTYSSYSSVLSSLSYQLSTLLMIPAEALREIIGQFEEYGVLVNDTCGLEFVLKVLRTSVNLCETAINRL